jgi:hypothetical protein
VEGTSRREVDVEHGGDRLRVGRAPGSIARANEPSELVGRFAAALELVHSASLVQEGLAAGDERHGRATAILDACATVTFDSRGMYVPLAFGPVNALVPLLRRHHPVSSRHFLDHVHPHRPRDR